MENEKKYLREKENLGTQLTVSVILGNDHNRVSRGQRPLFTPMSVNVPTVADSQLPIGHH